MSTENTTESIAPSASSPSPQSNETTAPSSEEAAVSASTTTIGASNTTSNDPLRSTRRRSLGEKRRSSLFARARASFYRSRGTSGASVETLRGTTGSDFEGYALLERCSAEEFDFLSCCCNPLSCCGTKDGLYFLLIKGYHVFVYKNEEGVSPKFAVELNHHKAVLQPKHGADCVVHLETSLGDIDYRITFSKSHLDENDTVTTPDAKAAAFVSAVNQAANAAQTDEVRTRLGHGGLLNKRSSVRYAIGIGGVKAKEQPEKPVGVGEVMREMPVAGGF
jgi:hypothetical protein